MGLLSNESYILVPIDYDRKNHLSYAKIWHMTYIIDYDIKNYLFMTLEIGVKGTILTFYKVGGPFLPLVEPEAASTLGRGKVVYVSTPHIP